MKRAFFLVLLCCCSQSPESLSVKDEKQIQFIERKQVYIGQSTLSLAGFLEKHRVVVPGLKDQREFFYIFDKNYKLKGMISEGGKFYYYQTPKELDHFGDYPIEDGLKLFFGYKLSDQIELKSILP